MIKGDEIFYKICFDSLLEGICIANEDRRIVMNNSALEDIFGYEKDELLGQKIDILIPEANRKIHQHHFDTYLKSPKKHKMGEGGEFKGRRKTGEMLDLEIGLNYFSHEGEFYVKVLISEISTRKKKEIHIKQKNRELKQEVQAHTAKLMIAVAELERSNHQLKEEIKDRVIAENKAKISFEKEKELNMMQTKFITLASHEFKTPLSGILTSAGLIEKYNEAARDPKISKHVDTIKMLVIQLNHILDDFLFMEKSENEDYELNLSKFKFCDVLDKLVKDADAILKQGQDLEFTPCKSSSIVWQDRKIIEIIIKNVLYNAIKYSPEHKVIKMKAEKNHFLKVTIEDEGIGIPKEALDHVFERFYRAKNALPIQGTGLGLNVAKRYLEKLNGRIDIQSEENRGTRGVSGRTRVRRRPPCKRQRAVGNARASGPREWESRRGR